MSGFVRFSNCDAVRFACWNTILQSWLRVPLFRLQWSNAGPTEVFRLKPAEADIRPPSLCSRSEEENADEDVGTQGSEQGRSVVPPSSQATLGSCWARYSAGLM